MITDARALYRNIDDLSRGVFAGREAGLPLMRIRTPCEPGRTSYKS